MRPDNMATLNDTLGVKRTIKHFDFSEPYWEATKQKKLVIQYCKATGKYQHFPRPVSIFTGPAARHRMARGVRQGRGVLLHHH